MFLAGIQGGGKSSDRHFISTVGSYVVTALIRQRVINAKDAEKNTKNFYVLYVKYPVIF